MKKNIRLFFLLIPFLSVFSGAYAAEKTPSSFLTTTPEPSHYIVQIVLSLVFILVIIFVSAWLLKRFSAFSGVTGGHLKVISALGVGQREKILVIQVGEEQLLLGVTTSQVTLLHKLEEKLEMKEPPPIIGSAFSKRLQDALKNQKLTTTKDKTK